jgi:hypothetical protein
MGIHANLETFFDRKVVDYEAGEPLPDPATTAVRLAVVYDGPIDEFTDAFAQFIESDGVENTAALVIGNWADPGDSPVPSQDAVETIVSGASKLPKLKALFFGDITSEENEISWIEQSDVSAFWGAFPHLEEIGIRGTNQLQLGRIKHASLKKLVIQTGGMPRTVLASVINADTPALEHLEVWLGTDGYGGDCRVADLAPLLDGTRFPNLKTLALRNCEWADDLAIAVAASPILSRIKTLDLSMGTIGDAGVGALVVSPAVKKLQHVNISHHYASDEMIARLQALGISVDASGKVDADEYGGGEDDRYVAVSE